MVRARDGKGIFGGGSGYAFVPKDSMHNATTITTIAKKVCMLFFNKEVLKEVYITKTIREEKIKESRDTMIL